MKSLEIGEPIIVDPFCPEGDYEDEVFSYSGTAKAELASWGLRYLPKTIRGLLLTSMEQMAAGQLTDEDTEKVHQSVAITIDLYRDEGLYMSPRLREDPNRTLSTTEEVSEYVGQWTAERLENTEAVYSVIADEPLDPRYLQAYVVVPVAAGETETIEKTVAQYARQSMRPDKWAILLYVNEFDQPENLMDDTLQKIRDLQLQYPQLPLRCANLSYRYSDKPTIGEIRADAWDVAMLELYKKGVSSGEMQHEVIGISHDADADWISPDYIQKMVDAAGTMPDKDLLTCQLAWTNAGQMDSDMNRILRYWDFVSDAARVRLGKIGAADGNTAIRISTYAAVGGFSRRQDLAELIDIRTRIAAQRYQIKQGMVRGHEAFDGVVGYVPDIRLKTNPRRVYQCMALGFAPDYAWNELPFETGLDEVRQLDILPLSQLKLSPEKLQEILDETDRLNFKGIDASIVQRLRGFGRTLLKFPPPLNAPE